MDSFKSCLYFNMNKHRNGAGEQNWGGLFLMPFVFLSTGALNKFKIQHQEDPNSTTLVANKPFLLRSLFTVGALGRHFDFDQEEFKGPNKVGQQLHFYFKTDKVISWNFDSNWYFVDQEASD